MQAREAVAGSGHGLEGNNYTNSVLPFSNTDAGLLEGQVSRTFIQKERYPGATSWGGGDQKHPPKDGLTVHTDRHTEVPLKWNTPETSHKRTRSHIPGPLPSLCTPLPCLVYKREIHLRTCLPQALPQSLSTIFSKGVGRGLPHLPHPHRWQTRGQRVGPYAKPGPEKAEGENERGREAERCWSNRYGSPG